MRQAARKGDAMLKLMECALLAASLLIVLGLVLQGPPEAPPMGEDALGAKERGDEAQPRAS
jgi:hypothetical protein